jgi:hypothetical protein
MFKRVAAASVGVAAALALTACNGDGDGALAAPDGTINERVLAKHLDTRPDGYYDNIAVGGRRCDVAVLLTSASEVDLYADAGAVVATNPDRTVGVKIVDQAAETCHRLLTEALADF